jgi:hypothetical protein
MSQDELKQIVDEESEVKSLKKSETEVPSQNHAIRPYNPIYPPARDKTSRKFIIVIIILNILLFFSCYINWLCGDSGNWRLESIYFTVDQEAELDEDLLEILYLDLDEDSRLNVTNMTYYLELSIPRFDYFIRFDYLFRFSSNNITNLSIIEHEKIPKISGDKFKYSPNFSVEFKINSLDPDIVNVTVIQPDNRINGRIDYIHHSVHYKLDDGTFGGALIENGIQRIPLYLPYNQTFIMICKYYNTCPFR